MNHRFYLTHLYPKHMEIYGDMGNIITLRHRLEQIGFEVIYQIVEIGEELPALSDIYFMGGGQDKEQHLIYQDLISKSGKLINDIENGTPLLAICGGFQLLGKEFITGDGSQIPGIGIFPVTTKAPDNSIKSRCIGNIIVESQIPDIEGLLIGFENHSGQTYFLNQPEQKLAQPLGKVLMGFGDNSIEKIEGCVYKNAVGTYMHGSCLPKNPQLANFLIKKAIWNKIQRGEIPADFDLDKVYKGVDDTIAISARKNIVNRYAPNLIKMI